MGQSLYSNENKLVGKATDQPLAGLVGKATDQPLAGLVTELKKIHTDLENDTNSMYQFKLCKFGEPTSQGVMIGDLHKKQFKIEVYDADTEYKGLEGVWDDTDIVSHVANLFLLDVYTNFNIFTIDNIRYVSGTCKYCNNPVKDTCSLATFLEKKENKEEFFQQNLEEILEDMYYFECISEECRNNYCDSPYENPFALDLDYYSGEIYKHIGGSQGYNITYAKFKYITDSPISEECIKYNKDSFAYYGYNNEILFSSYMYTPKEKNIVLSQHYLHKISQLLSSISNKDELYQIYINKFGESYRDAVIIDNFGEKCIEVYDANEEYTVLNGNYNNLCALNNDIIAHKLDDLFEEFNSYTTTDHYNISKEYPIGKCKFCHCYNHNNNYNHIGRAKTDYYKCANPSCPSVVNKIVSIWSNITITMHSGKILRNNIICASYRYID
jgi:hypothetical protein